MTEVLNINDGVLVLNNKKMTPTEAIDKLEVEIFSKLPLVNCPLSHKFTKGLYSRTIFMPKGSLITSEIHLTHHQYIVSGGVVSVWSDNFGEEVIESPYLGETTPNTRRVLYVHEDCTWTTFHPTDLTSVEEIEDTILDKRRNPLLVKMFEELVPYVEKLLAYNKNKKQ